MVAQRELDINCGLLKGRGREERQKREWKKERWLEEEKEENRENVGVRERKKVQQAQEWFEDNWGKYHGDSKKSASMLESNRTRQLKISEV